MASQIAVVADAHAAGDRSSQQIIKNEAANEYVFAVVGHIGSGTSTAVPQNIMRPTLSETGMFAAYGAQLRSACLSRQVGASLLDQRGNVLAIGTNEVPKEWGWNLCPLGQS